MREQRISTIIGIVFCFIALCACTGAISPSPVTSPYDQLVLGDSPIAFWALSATTDTEKDLTGNGHTGTYIGGTPAHSTMPNGDSVALFNGSTEYLTVPPSAAFSIPTTGNLTWEAWIQPSTLQFPNSLSGNYIAYMGKCAAYSPTCEWEARMYNTTNTANRCNRLSAYAYNPTAGLGSGAFWQPACGLFQAGEWLHVVAEYTTNNTPSGLGCSTTYPGSIAIWVNGVEWSMSANHPTGCMSQFSVTPMANASPLNIGTMAKDSWFQGAIGKVAIYNYLLSQSQITAHYAQMTGNQPTGNCAATCTF